MGRDMDNYRAYQREYCAKRRRAWLADKCCVRCGAIEDLQVHHIDPALKISHNVWSWKEEKRLVELAKCEVLCGGCHRALHCNARKKHSLSRYLAGCRCETCKEAYRTERRKIYRSKVRRQKEQQNAGVV